MEGDDETAVKHLKRVSRTIAKRFLGGLGEHSHVH